VNLHNESDAFEPLTARRRRVNVESKSMKDPKRSTTTPGPEVAFTDVVQQGKVVRWQPSLKHGSLYTGAEKPNEAV
jgi:hypothetical protein